MTATRIGARESLRRAAALAVVATAVLVVPASLSAQGPSTVVEPSVNASALTIIAPAAPGGGWDQLAREMQREIERQRLATSVQVENIPGAAGTIGLAQLINGRRGNGRTLLVNGLVMLGAILWNQSPVSIAQTTPIARLTGEYEIVAVPSGSPHRDMQSLLRSLRESPAGVSWAGGSAGGTDHILAGLIVAAAGVDPRRTNYIAFSGGGEAAAALVGGQVTAGISGYSEFAPHIESGRLRALGISAPQRVSTLDIPTFVEQGLDVELANWRAVVAPPGLEAGERQALTAVVERMVRSDEWRGTLARLGWTDAYLAGSAFETFLDQERIRIARIVSRLRGSGAASTLDVGEWLLPSLVIAAACLTLVFLVLRQRQTSIAQPGRSVAPIGLALALFVCLLEPAGFVMAGTALFAATAAAFGRPRWGRDALLGLLLCGAVYLAFTRGLGVALPAGWLAR